MRVRIIYWKPWADRKTDQPWGRGEGELDAVLQDAREWLKEGRPVVLEPLDDPGEAPIPKGGA